MNSLQRIWNRATARFMNVPTSASARNMSELEVAILEDLKRDPAKWTCREYQTGEIRSDSRGVTIFSHRSPIVEPRVGTTFGCYTYTARCGALNFGPVFAEQWDRVARARATEKHRAEIKAAADRVEAELRKVFVE